MSSLYEKTEGSDSSNQTTFYGSEEGCARYTRSFTEQLTLEKNEGEILQEVFSSLPNLDYIRCSDDRYLVRRGESYDQLSHRLFNNTLQPENFFTSVQCWRVMSRFIRAITKIPHARIKAFEIPTAASKSTPLAATVTQVRAGGKRTEITYSTTLVKYYTRVQPARSST